MGITELIRLLKPATRNIYISEFSGKTAAIDMMTWLYRGVYACSYEIGMNQETDQYLNYPLKMISLLQAHKIKPIAVFDGKRFKPKSDAEIERRENKIKYAAQAQKCVQEGDKNGAEKFFKQSLRISNKMMNTMIDVLKRLGIKVIIAPYEADAELAFLCKSNQADFAISEDSDLILFGAKRICYKLNPNGDGVLLDMDKFKEIPPESIGDPYCQSIQKIKLENFVELCVLSGCDYYPGIKSLGLKIGVKLYENGDDLKGVVERMKKMDRFKNQANDELYKTIRRLVSIFMYQTIYNNLENKLLPLNSPNDIPENSAYKTAFEENKEDVELYGKEFENYDQYCNANLDMKTLLEKKELESEEVIKSNIENYFNMLKFDIIKAKNIFRVDKLKSEQIVKGFIYENKKNFKHIPLLETKKMDDRFEDLTNDPETQKFLREAYKLNNQNQDYNINSIDLEEENLEDYMCGDGGDATEAVKKDELKDIKDSKSKVFHQLGDASIEVDFLIKMCENAKKNDEPKEAKKQEEEANINNCVFLEGTTAQDCESKSEAKLELKEKKDLFSLFNTEKFDFDVFNIASAKTTFKTPEQSEISVKLNPFLKTSEKAKVQKNALNVLKSPPNTDKPTNAVPLLGNKRKHPEKGNKISDPIAEANKKKLKTKNQKEQALVQNINLIEPDSSVSVSSTKNPNVNNYQVNLLNVFKSMQEKLEK